MKNILLILFLMSGTIVRAQTFEGIMTWKISAEMDAATKAKMDAAQQKMNDPETQAQMKEMKEKMNDPEFKKMMEANPQMKAQMEQMMKMSEGGGDMTSYMPKAYVVKIKDQNVLTHMEGGIMGNIDVLYLPSKNTTYKINREAKTYSVMSGPDTAKVKDVKITKTSETAKILNYTCTKYTAESTAQGHTMHQIFWATTEIKGLDMKALARQSIGNNQQRMFFEKIDGVPLKIELKDPKFGMTMEVVEIKKQSLPASDFVVPKDYKAE
ncbi:MAG TPA: DUF4412 domain-containing protein [Chryseolinea sp.]|nr:DUF4412 domain-containing protein [Chryseolinea sp.]